MRFGEDCFEILESITDAAFTLDQKWRFVYLNSEAERVLLRSREELLGKNLWEEFPEAVGSTFYRQYHKAVEERVTVRFEEYYPPLKAWFEAKAYPSEVGLLVYFHDVTKRKRAEEALRKSEQRFRQLFEQSVDAVFVHDEQGCFVDCNSRACLLLGYSREELLSLSVRDISCNMLTEEEQARQQKEGGTLWQRAIACEPGTFVVSHEEMNRRKDGTTFPVEVRVGSVDYGGRQMMLASTRDITERKEAEEALKESEERYRGLVELSPETIAVHSEGRFVYVNLAGVKLFGATGPEELLGKPVMGFVHPDYREFARERIRRIQEEGMVAELAEEKLVGLDGRIIDVEIAGLSFSYGGKPATQLIIRDITERKRAEERLEESEARFRSTFENASTGVALVGLDNRYLKVNRAFCEMLGYQEEELLYKNSLEVTHPADLEKSRDRTRRLLDGRAETAGIEKRYVRKDGSVVWALSDVSLVRDTEGNPGHLVAQYQNITERKALEERLEYRAFHDLLTSLPNRALFLNRLKHSLARLERREGKVAVLFVDLDNFKFVNDTLGHHVGDDLLVAVSARLRGCVRPEDTIARLGGDEFAVLLEDVEGAGKAAHVAERIVEELRMPFTLSDQEVFITPSIGIALSDPSHDLPEDLLRNADIAMYRAKEEGKACYRMFSPSMESRITERLRLENDLRRALERDEFKVHYQPVMLLETKRIIGMEALVRWEHPERALVTPDEFVPLAEEIGLIIPIGQRVLREACRQAKEWQVLYPSNPPLNLSVNLSTRQLQHPDLIKDVEEVLRETELDPRGLTLEITESAVIGEGERRIPTLHRLRELGVRLALDDFGTGYSSLSYLRRLPVGMLKIDRTFVENIGNDAKDEALLSGVAGIASRLGLYVVAEGVETAEQLAHVKSLGCELAQGNYFSEPLPGEAARELLATYRH